MPLSFVLARIAARTGAAVWRHRFGWFGAALCIGALAAYELAAAGPSQAPGDCADTAMAAVTSDDDAAARAAYNCLGPGLRNTSEDAWVASMRHRAIQRAQVNRVGDQPSKDGGRIVFFTVDQQDQSIGYIVYLDPRGKVRAVE